MGIVEKLETLRQAGSDAIRDEAAQGDLIPLDQTGVVFQQMFEYPVGDFLAEVGFYSLVFGFAPIALTEDYALFTHSHYRYCLSFRASSGSPDHTMSGLKLLLMTSDIDAAATHLREAGLVPGMKILKGSPTQSVIHLMTPAGVAIEIWEDPTPSLS